MLLVEESEASWPVDCPPCSTAAEGKVVDDDFIFSVVLVFDLVGVLDT